MSAFDGGKCVSPDRLSSRLWAHILDVVENWFPHPLAMTATAVRPKASRQRGSSAQLLRLHPDLGQERHIYPSA